MLDRPPPPTTGTTETAQFIFNTTDGLTALGIPTTTWSVLYDKDTKTTKGNYYDLDASKTYTSGNATFSTANNPTLYDAYNANGDAVKTNTRIWKNTYSGTTYYNLRFYTGSTITIGAAKGYAVQSIDFELPQTSGGKYNGFDLMIDGGTLTNNGATTGQASWTAGEGKTVKSATFYIPSTGQNTYINTITVTLVKVNEDENPDDASKFKVVNNFAQLKALTDGTPCVLNLADGDNARVLYNYENQTFLRDNTGAVCFYGFVKSPTMKYNQHVAGYIIGEKNTVGNLPVLKSYGNMTNTTYLAIADQVTEDDVTPKEISVSDYANNYADWVTVKELRVKDLTNDVASFKDEEAKTLTPTFGNNFKLTDNDYYKKVYQDALVDISGIAYPVNSDQLVAAVYNRSVKSSTMFKPVTFVIDETKSFTSPNTDIQNARVRLVRTLYNDGWNTLALPFEYGSFKGKIKTLDKMADDGTTMLFKDATSIEAGVPYLVWPDEQISDPVFEDVTLQATSPQTATCANNSNYSFVAIYSPTELKDDGSNLFLGADITLKKPITKTDANPLSQTLRGTRAYYVVPVNRAAKIGFVNEFTTAIGTITPTEKTDAPAPIYTLDGRYVGSDRSRLAKGIYIVGNKKIVIK